MRIETKDVEYLREVINQYYLDFESSIKLFDSLGEGNECYYLILNDEYIDSIFYKDILHIIIKYKMLKNEL